MQYQLVYNMHDNLYHWEDDDGNELLNRDVPVRTRTELTIAELKEKPHMIGVLRPFMHMNRMPVHQVCAAALTYYIQHTLDDKHKFVYRRDGMIDIYLQDKYIGIKRP